MTKYAALAPKLHFNVPGRSYCESERLIGAILSIFYKFEVQRSKLPHEQVLATMQFWSHHSSNIYQVATFVKNTEGFLKIQGSKVQVVESSEKAFVRCALVHSPQGQNELLHTTSTSAVGLAPIKQCRRVWAGPFILSQASACVLWSRSCAVGSCLPDSRIE